MHLKRLEIHGFKSFAQKTTMEFSSGIIAIVGPNGSGKSNVADCLRWVLGEQSAKLIRGKKSDDVIFAGSEKKSKLGFAEVVATFDNSDNRIPVDSAEVSIGRRIDRSGESEYLINNNRVRLLDIVDLVLKSNIGTSRYTVIGQGTIDQMVLAGPSEVKDLLDEASGVKNYYVKRDKTLRRLEQTAQNLMRAEDLIAEIEPRLKSLRRQAKRMEARAELEQELKIYQREFYGKNYWLLKASSDNFGGQLAALVTERTMFEKELAGLRMKAEHEETENLEQVRTFKDIRENLSRLQGQKNKLLEDVSLVRGKMQSQKTVGGVDAATLQLQAHELNATLEQTTATVKQLREDQTMAKQATIVQAQLLAEINQQLDELYQHSSMPQQIDWKLFNLELNNLEQLIVQFYNELAQGMSGAQLMPAAAGIKKQFENFKQLAKEITENPQNSLIKLQEQLRRQLMERDRIAAEFSSLELDLSKILIQMEFLEKQQRTVQQEKLHIDLELKKTQSHSYDEFLQNLMLEETRINEEVEMLAQQINQLEDSFKTQQDAESQKQRELHTLEGEFRTKQDNVSRLKDKESAINIEKTKIDTQLQTLTEEITKVLGQKILENICEQNAFSQEENLEEKIAKLKNQLDMIGGMDELTLKEYQETEARFNALNSQIEDLRKGMEDLRQVMDELDIHIKTKFNEGFYKINEKFEYYFRVLFNGGRAYLNLIKNEAADAEATADTETDTEGVETPPDGLRPEEKIVKKYGHGASSIAGIDIKATPPGKKLASIQALSGGERALTSIALLCSLLTCFPSPFVVLDEVDAALDDANTIRFGQILGTLAHQTQFITITHNRETMAQASMLYGVTMGDDGVSKLLSVKLEQAKEFAK